VIGIRPRSQGREQQKHERYGRPFRAPRKAPTMGRLVPTLLIAVGLALMVAQIHADSEPGAVPLALVGLGLGTYGLARSRHRRGGNQRR